MDLAFLPASFYISKYIDTLFDSRKQVEYTCMKANVVYDRLSYTRKVLCALATLQNDVLSLKVRQSTEIRISCL